MDGSDDNPGPIAILDVGRMDHDTHQQARRVGHNMASRAGEFHPHALLDPYMSLSIHTAPDVQPLAYRRRQWANSVELARTTRANHPRAPAVRARSRLYL